MTDDDFTKLNNLFDSKLKPVVDRLDVMQEDIEAIRETTQATAVSIDKQIGVNEDLRMEYAAVNVQLTRHEGWIKELADKTEVKLEY